MRFEWEPGDIRVGRVVGDPGRGERWMIGYMAESQLGEGKRYTLNSLSDGLVQMPRTAAELADSLNKTGEWPSELLPPTVV